jgi:hypothetical protein
MAGFVMANYVITVILVVLILVGIVLLKGMSVTRRLVIWYHFEPINISKLVIGLGFHCDDWNIFDRRPRFWFLTS